MSDRASSPIPASIPTTQQQPATAEVQVKEEESLTLPSPTTSVGRAETNPDWPLTSPGSSRRRSEAQRRAFLRDDPLAQEVDPWRVLCRGCHKWIKLSSSSNYALANWQTHKPRCCALIPAPRSERRTPSRPSFSPGSRVATAERKIVLLNDPQVRACSPGHVRCGTCKLEVALEGDVDYDLTKWTEHKERCAPMTPTPIASQGHAPRVFPPPSTSSTHSHVSAGGSHRSPIPVEENASAGTTTVNESPPAAVEIGVKRGREEETEDEEKVATDERPTNRARTKTYNPPEGVLGWFMQPLKEFARGFREGLSST